MAKPFQFLLLIFGVIALVAVGGELAYSIIATTHGSTPARVVKVQAGPFPLIVNLYNLSPHASHAPPFPITPPGATPPPPAHHLHPAPAPLDPPATPVPP